MILEKLFGLQELLNQTNLAIKGAVYFYSDKGKHIVTSKIEHKAVLDVCRQLESESYEVTYLEPNNDGIITPESV